MLLAILSICSQEELDSESDGEDEEEVQEEEEALRTEAVAARRQAIKNKIMAVGRMQKVFQILRFVVLAILLIYNLMLGDTGKRQRMLLNWRPIVLVGLLPVLDLTCKAPESIGAFVHLLMRKFHLPSSWSFPPAFTKNQSFPFITAVVLISPMNVYPTLRPPVLLYSQFQV